MLSRIHVNSPYLFSVTNTLVATSMILGGLDCVWFWNDNYWSLRNFLCLKTLAKDPLILIQ